MFLVYHSGILQAENIPLSEIIKVIPASLRLDIATAAYIMVFPFLLLMINVLWSNKWIDRVNLTYTLLITMGYSLTVGGEMGLYPEWKTKLTYKVIKYFSHPSEIYNSAGTGIFFGLLALFVLLTAIGFISYRRFFYKPITQPGKPYWLAGFFVILTPGLLFTALRGGIQQIPINQSESYFSKYNILNCASVNNLFNLYISVFENLNNFNGNPYIFMSTDEASSIMKKLYKEPDSTITSILTTPRPNVVLIILESWSADLIVSLGGKPGISPEFTKLEKEGLLFDQIFASGSRSEQGMASIFSGFPAHPISSITVQPDKIVALPGLISRLNKMGYQTAFYFGGQLIYGNIKSYIMYLGFDKIMEGADFPSSIPRGKLGIHDEFTLSYMAEEMGRMQQPFMTALFTLSTHSPWDQPFPKPLKWGENENEYINSAYYTDHCLGEFFRLVKKELWYANTLFILVADHSRNSYRNWHPQSALYHRIPFLFVGDVIKPEFRGTKWSKFGNQHDLAATLLGQLGESFHEFPYSKNLLNKSTAEFAYFTTEDGVGWIRPPYQFTYERTGNFIYPFSSPNVPDSIKKEGFAYLQTVFSDYLSR
jgi:phosphoglycerol transferase MdoB-like AlkP superfamily enzyme